MKSFTSFNYYHNSKSDQLDVILQGGSHGIESSLLQKAFENSKQKGNSAMAFNFPYYERGEENSSGPELKEELDMLQQILDYCNYKEYKHVRLIAKSLGGIVASRYLDKLLTEDMDKFSIIVLGYVTGDVRLNNFNGQITIIQGEKDKFGNIEVVKKDLNDSASNNIKFIEIPNGDHSYRDPETKESKYEDLAIAEIN